ncbi:hypothetical protein JCM15519_07420 [Fundidesulfovibrio butyratiphilus]
MNLPRLAQHLQDQGIMGKPFNELSREEVEALVRACWDAADAEDVRRFPYFQQMPASGERVLVSPCDAPTVFRTWLCEDGWIEMYHMLKMLGATDEEMARYLGPDWLERMHKRTKFKPNPHCPVCGRPMSKETS